MKNRTRVYDNGGKTIDRYTLVTPSQNTPRHNEYFGFNDNPFHPQGFGQYCGEYPFSHSGYRHLGKRIKIDSLPEPAQRYVNQVTEEV